MERMSLELTGAEVSCLISHLPLGSSLVSKLSQSRITESPKTRRIGFSNTVHCTLNEASELLDVALQHCPDAVGEILRCINQCNFESS